ncbi:UNVERIFIED_CONTAM: hypothetical protein NCL1_30637 [Trichonephila clavipes]
MPKKVIKCEKPDHALEISLLDAIAEVSGKGVDGRMSVDRAENLSEVEGNKCASIDKDEAEEHNLESDG